MLKTSVVEFEMPIWRVLPFNDSPHLALELRDAGKLATRFATVSVDTGNLELEPTAGPEPWWMGLQGAGQQRLILHQFRQQPQVGVSGLVALDSASGKVQWEHAGLAFGRIESPFILAQPTGTPEAELQPLLALTGEKANGQFAYREPEQTNGPFASQFPAAYLPDNPYYDTLSEFLDLKIGQKVQGPIEYLETDRFIIFSIHVPLEQDLANYLVIFANNGHLRYKRCLAKELTGFAADTFFVFEGKVVAVQDRQRLLLIDCEN